MTAPPATAAAPVAAPEATPAPIATPASLPPAVEYNLGDATLVQERFPEDSRFRNMPVRLNGVIAVPEGDGGPYPVAVILHGTHPGCPVMGDIDPWPCDPEEEQPNYRGFGYLASALAAKGYVVLVPNINAENTFGFGEPTPHERLGQLLDLQLQALAEAAAGGENKFGVDLAGRADMHRLALIGHSRGGEAAVALANNPDSPLGAPGGAYGPAAGTLLVAPAVVTFDPAGGSRVPSAIVISGCDGDVVSGDGQFFYEAARLAPKQRAPSTAVYLEHANHNGFNSILGRDPFGAPDRSACATLLDPEAQRTWLEDYAADFLTTLFSDDPAAVRSATMRMGTFAFDPAPSELYGLDAQRGCPGPGQEPAAPVCARVRGGVCHQPGRRERDRRGDSHHVLSPRLVLAAVDARHGGMPPQHGNRARPAGPCRRRVGQAGRRAADRAAQGRGPAQLL